jgi:hypothetical protein
VQVAELFYAPSRWDRWENVVIRVQLRDGSNLIRLSRTDQFAEVDAVDVAPAVD